MLPSLAIRLSDLAKSSAPAPTKSGHSVKKVYFTQDTGLNGLGYLKVCDPSYCPLRAKYNVARSVFYRATLGARASEERLVYNRENKISGTVSVAIPGFVPMQKYNPSKSSSKSYAINELSNPTPHTLIEKNVAELLVTSYRHQNDDVHPDNFSLAGLIDLDMCGIENIALKDERVTSGLLHTSQAFGTLYLSKDLDTFPVLESFRTHWPTHALPQNGNIFKIYQCHKSFEALKDCPKSREQTFVAFLKELLSFQYAPLKKRLDARLGSTTPIDLDSLAPSDGSENIRKHELLSLMKPEFFYKKNRPGQQQERTFVEHFMLHMKSEFDSLYQLITNYPEFGQIIHNNPEAYQSVRHFFETDNTNYPEDERYDLEKMDADYLRIIRDSMRPTIFQLLDRTQTLIESVQADIDYNKYFNKKYTENQSLLKPAKICHETQAKETIFSNKIKHILELLLTHLGEYASELFNSSEASVDTNAQFVDDINHLLTASHEAIKSIVSETPSFNFKQKSIYATLMKDWQKTLAYLVEQPASDNMLHISSPAFKYARSQVPQTIDLSTPLPNNIDSTISELMCSWFKKTSISDINIYINIALKEYEPKRYITAYFWGALRTTSIEDLQKKAANRNDTNSYNLVKDIFLAQDSGWEASSFNTILMKTLLIKILPIAGSDIANTKNYRALTRFNAQVTNDDFLYPHILKIKDELMRAFSTSSTAYVEVVTSSSSYA